MVEGKLTFRMFNFTLEEASFNDSCHQCLEPAIRGSDVELANIAMMVSTEVMEVAGVSLVSCFNKELLQSLVYHYPVCE